MNTKLLTNTELAERLAAARERERKARAAVGRLQRRLAATDRRLAAQIKITLGAALLRAVDAEPRHADALRRLLHPHLTRPTDRDCLRDTPFAFSEPAAVTNEAAEPGEDA